MPIILTEDAVIVDATDAEKEAHIAQLNRDDTSSFTDQGWKNIPYLRTQDDLQSPPVCVDRTYELSGEASVPALDPQEESTLIAGMLTLPDNVAALKILNALTKEEDGLPLEALVERKLVAQSNRPSIVTLLSTYGLVLLRKDEVLHILGKGERVLQYLQEKNTRNQQVIDQREAQQITTERARSEFRAELERCLESKPETNQWKQWATNLRNRAEELFVDCHSIQEVNEALSVLNSALKSERKDRKKQYSLT